MKQRPEVEKQVRQIAAHPKEGQPTSPNTVLIQRLLNSKPFRPIIREKALNEWLLFVVCVGSLSQVLTTACTPLF